jgi:PAS domain S-box-containing protein
MPRGRNKAALRSFMSIQGQRQYRSGGRVLINEETARHLLETAVDAVETRPTTFREVLHQIPAAIYLTDTEGTITYFNKACVDLAGRTPRAGEDKWCVTWKLYTTEGESLAHDQCPMAVAIKDKRAVRDVEAIAERPDGTRIHFIPFPTPLFDCDGNLAGAVNLLLDVTERRRPEFLRSQAERCRRLAASIADEAAAEALLLMSAKYDEQAFRLARLSKRAA